jgi:hypothetical protein
MERVRNNFPVLLILVGALFASFLAESLNDGKWGGSGMVHYGEGVERRMKVLFGRLSEKDRRRYAAVEADKLGHGGQQYIAELFGIDIKTIRQGLSELDVPEDPAGKQIRKKAVGGNASST